jgi:hypothetical protein
MAQVLAATAAGQAPPAGALQRLLKVAPDSQHPLVHVRLARVQYEVAGHEQAWPAAEQAALRQAEGAERAGLKEALAEAWWMQAWARWRAGAAVQAVLPPLQAAQALALQQGFAGVLARVQALQREISAAHPRE